MATFVSYSREPGHLAARIVAQFLQDTTPECAPWISDKITVGKQWMPALSAELARADAIVLCHTRESRDEASQWLPFEAGATWKGSEARRVLSLLVDDDVQLELPLAAFQAARADVEGLMALIEELRQIHGVAPPPPDSPQSRDRRRLAERACDEIRSSVGTYRARHPRAPKAVVALRPEERAGGDNDLQRADRLQLLGLTFKQLSSAMSTGTFRLRAMDITLAIYSLPVLCKTHPKLSMSSGSESALSVSQEWRRCFTDVLRRLQTDDGVETLTVRLASFQPGFSMSVLEYSHGERQIRFNAHVPGYEPMDLPVLKLYEIGNERSEGFSKYDNVRRQYFETDHTLQFVLKRNSRWIWPGEPDRFCSRLSSVCMNPLLAPMDRRYEVLAPKAQRGSLARSHVEVDLHDWWFDERPGGHPPSALALSPRGFEGERVPLNGEHIVGAFVLLHSAGTIALKFRGESKSRWEYDVPGGRVSTEDANVADGAVREVFEEMGLLIDGGRLVPEGVKYDPRGAGETTRVVVVYYSYRLDPGEEKYLRTAEHDSKGRRIDWWSFRDLCGRPQEQRPVCHVPASVVEALAKRSAAS